MKTLMPALTAGLILVGCHAQRPRFAELPYEDCPVDRMPKDGTPWRLARGDGFTYCVPALWRAWQTDSGAYWSGSLTSVSWSRRPGGAAVPLHGSAFNRAGLPDCPSPITYPDSIGGFVVRIARSECGRAFYTSARWDNRVLVLYGFAQNREKADQHLSIFSTVRFNSW